MDLCTRVNTTQIQIYMWLELRVWVVISKSPPWGWGASKAVVLKHQWASESSGGLVKPRYRALVLKLLIQVGIETPLLASSQTMLMLQMCVWEPLPFTEFDFMTFWSFELGKWPSKRESLVHSVWNSNRCSCVNMRQEGGWAYSMLILGGLETQSWYGRWLGFLPHALWSHFNLSAAAPVKLQLTFSQAWDSCLTMGIHGDILQPPCSLCGSAEIPSWPEALVPTAVTHSLILTSMAISTVPVSFSPLSFSCFVEWPSK